jgi:hypothetical protein
MFPLCSTFPATGRCNPSFPRENDPPETRPKLSLVTAASPADERRRPRPGSLERPINGRLYRGTWLLVGLPLLLLAFSVARPSALHAPNLPQAFGRRQPRPSPATSRPTTPTARRALPVRQVRPHGSAPRSSRMASTFVPIASRRRFTAAARHSSIWWPRSRAVHRVARSSSWHTAMTAEPAPD